MNLPSHERFWAKVDVRGPDECWEWTDCRDGYGYRRLFMGHDASPAVDRSHRLAIALSGVVVPRTRCVLHHCDNPPCCNPRHLYIGTKADNARDREARNRRAPLRTHCGRGHEYTSENTQHRPNGVRRCKACDRLHGGQYGRPRRMTFLWAMQGDSA